MKKNRVPFDWLIIDGYSLIHRDPDLQPLLPHRIEQARNRLIRKLETGSGIQANRVTVVFDGKSAGISYEQGTQTVEVFFSPAHATADTVIEQWCSDHACRLHILVVTADRMERETVTASGAQCMSCAAFLDALSDQRKIVRNSMSRKQPKSFTLGDVFPHPTEKTQDDKTVQ